MGGAKNSFDFNAPLPQLSLPFLPKLGIKLFVGGPTTSCPRKKKFPTLFWPTKRWITPIFSQLFSSLFFFYIFSLQIKTPLGCKD